MSCEPEVTDFQLISLRTDQQVLRLNISMHDIHRVEILDSPEKLVYKEFGALMTEAVRFFLEDFE